MSYPRLAQLRTPKQFSRHLAHLGIQLPFDPEVAAGPDSPLAQSFSLPGFHLANRFCVQPMEGWDANPDGSPSPLTFRRWQHFGQSGAALVWGGEAVAVTPEGRANPNQLVIQASTLPGLVELRQALLHEHTQRWPGQEPYIGLQLTHSGRFCRPRDKHRLEPKILYHHPILDRKFGLPADAPVLADWEIEKIISAYHQAAVLAQKAGFHFVDIKHCHGYLGHEFLSAVDRPGKYGGSLENRTRFLREIAEGIRSAAPGIEIGVRLSAFDFIPFCPGRDGIGEPEPWENNLPYPYAFGGDGTGTGIDLAEPGQFLKMLEDLGIRLVNITAGSPYYNPHIQRPALFPPSDGYKPPEDPLVGVARQIQVTAALKAHHPALLIVGTAYSYLQEWLPHVAQAVVRNRMADFVGLGRAILSYPEMPADILAGRPLQRKRICRTFSDCTTGPRRGLVSGCYPLDDFYRNLPEASLLSEAKRKT